MNGKEKPKGINRLTTRDTSLTTGNLRDSGREPPLREPKGGDGEITFFTKEKLCLRPEQALWPTVRTVASHSHLLQRSHFLGNCKHITWMWVLHFILRHFVLSFINVIK